MEDRTGGKLHTEKDEKDTRNDTRWKTEQVESYILRRMRKIRGMIHSGRQNRWKVTY